MNVGGATEPTGSVDVALAHAARLLERDPALAAEQAGEILKAAPTHPGATLILGVARRRGGDAAAALEVLKPLVESQPRWAAARYELGVALGDVGAGEQAVIELRRAVELNPELPEAWRSLADHLAAMGDDAGADAARAHSRVRRATQGCSPRALRSARTASRKPRPCCDATCTSTRPTSPPSACSPK